MYIADIRECEKRKNDILKEKIEALMEEVEKSIFENPDVTNCKYARELIVIDFSCWECIFWNLKSQ